ncbi:MAG: serine/threonine protein kinase [Tabrizicola sp.]|nr:serine/threonine protein kinase [Tabrizicola sp.]
MTSAALKIDPVSVGSDADELLPGTRLLYGQFKIESFLNSGGFGIVYSARNSLDRQVVIKECFPSSFCRRIDKAVGPRTRARLDEFQSVVRLFVQEAHNLSRLDHPGVVKVHQVFEENDTAYMAMDYIKGPDLLQTVEGSARPLIAKEIISLLDKILDAIGYVHAQGLLHRDISPDNIILNEATGQPVLIDFGASRKEVTRKSRAVSGLRVVKDGYSPQEFYVSGSTQAPCSDLYALAATFYHLITQETPKTSQERLSAIAGGEGDPLRPLAGRFKAYPPVFLQAIDKAMSIFPRDRLQSVDEWRAMLGNLAAQPKAAPISQPRPSVQPASAAYATEAEAAPKASEAVSTPRNPAAPLAAPEASVATPAPALSQLVVVRGPRDFLVSSAAAILLLSGLLSLPHGLGRNQATVLPVAVGADVAQTNENPASTLAVTNVLRLPSGLAFETVETATGTQTIVSNVPAAVHTDLKSGDVLLVYTASGETLGTPTALREILQREFANGVSTYSFVIRRGASTMDAEFHLEVAD